jgi:heat shock protein HtpX
MNVVRRWRSPPTCRCPGLRHRRHGAERFATGRDPKHASIAITTGLLEKLDREELQGVIGHELSHVRNFDIRFSLIVRRDGRGDRDPRPTSSCASRSGAAGGVGPLTAGAMASQPVIMIVQALVLAILAPSSAGFIQLAVQPSARVPRRRVGAWR